VKAVGREPGALRVGVTTANPLGETPDPEHVAAVRETAEALAGLGHRVEEITPELPGPEALPLFETVFAAHISLGAAAAQLMAGREAGPEDVEPLSRAMMERAAATSSTEYLGAVALLQIAARRVIALWADIDVLLVPALAERPPRIGTIDGSDPENFERAIAFAPYAGLFNVTGQPAITVPAGLGADGLPTTVQVVGPPLGEDTLLQLAAQLEVARPWVQRRPGLTPVPR
jgi:amidase